MFTNLNGFENRDDSKFIIFHNTRFNIMSRENIKVLSFYTLLLVKVSTLNEIFSKQLFHRTPAELFLVFTKITDPKFLENLPAFVLCRAKRKVCKPDLIYMIATAN